MGEDYTRVDQVSEWQQHVTCLQDVNVDCVWQQRSPQEVIPVVETERIEGLFVTLHQKSSLKENIDAINKKERAGFGHARF